jgi:hypothetical protein
MRHSIHVVERSATRFAPADIIVNELGCIIVINITDVVGMEDLKNRMDSFIWNLGLLATQFEECTTLIELYSNNATNIDTYNDSLKYCSVFCSRISSLTLSMSMQVRYLYSQTVEESAELLRHTIREMEQRATEKRRTEKLWIKEVESDHCKFLSQFPGINVSLQIFVITIRLLLRKCF